MLRRASWAAVKLLSQPAGACRATVLHQQTRTTVIMKRMFPELPPREKEDIPKKKTPKYIETQIEDQVLLVVENTEHRPRGKMEVLLVKDIEGIGMKGEVIEVKKAMARDLMLPMGLAVYPSPENREKYKEDDDSQTGRPSRSMSSQRTLSQMKEFTLRVPMSATNPWTLNRKHVRVAFRKMGVEVQESCIKMPSGPVITEPQEISVELTMNNMDTFTVKAIVHHYDPEPTEKQQFPPVWVGKEKVELG